MSVHGEEGRARSGDGPVSAPNMPLRREDWTVAPVSQVSAASAIEAWHYAQGCPNTSVGRHGLFRAGGRELMGVAMWLPPTPTAARSAARHFDIEDEWRGVLSLTRLVIAPEVPTNGASFLLGRSMRLLDRSRWPILLTYADTSQGHTGAIYKATNWEEIGPVPAGDTWVGPNGEQRGRKRGKRNLSVVEMTELGFVRRPAAPKIKFVHRATGKSVRPFPNLFGVELGHSDGGHPGHLHECRNEVIDTDVRVENVDVDCEVGHHRIVGAA